MCGVVLSTDSRVFQSVVEEWAGRGGCELHQGGTSNEAGANGHPQQHNRTTLMRACRRWERDDSLQLATYTADLHYLQLSIRTGSAPRLKLWSAARSPPPEKTPILWRLMCLKQNVVRAQATAGSWLRPTSQRQARHQLNNTIRLSGRVSQPEKHSQLSMSSSSSVCTKLVVHLPGPSAAEDRRKTRRGLVWLVPR